MLRREKVVARTRAIKVLDFAMQTEDGAKNCERFVEMLGLKTFFSAFMGKVSFFAAHPIPLLIAVAGRRKAEEACSNICIGR